MINKIEHIGIAVKSLKDSNKLFESLFGKANYKIELLEATNEDGPIAKFIAKKGEGIHHIAFDVDDIEAEIKRLKSEGFQVLNDKPKKGADNKLVVFLHPKSTNGVLIELCQEIK
jgi:methylmalonyl-CoA/ethylmalonyl-CoA epimerase